MSSQNVKMRGGGSTLFPCFGYILSLHQFLPFFLLNLHLSSSPLIPTTVSNFYPSLDEYYGNNSQFYFWSSDWNIVWQRTTKFRVISFAFMHGFYITQHIGSKQHIDCAPRSEHWEVGLNSLFLPGAASNKNRTGTEYINTTDTPSVRLSTNIRELKKISVLNLFPYYYHSKDIIDFPVRLQGLKRNSIFLHSTYNDFHAQIKRKVRNCVKTILSLYLPHLQRELQTFA